MKAWEGVGVVASARKLIGATNPLQAEPGTIRGDLAVQTGRLVLRVPFLLCVEYAEKFYMPFFLDVSSCQWMNSYDEFLK